MKFHLGRQIISPENDGGIKICYQTPAKKTTAWNERMPVLSIEVPFPYFMTSLTSGKTKSWEK